MKAHGELTDDKLLRLARIARIPDEKLPEFRSGLEFVFYLARGNYEFDRERAKNTGDARIEDVGKAADSLLRALEKLDGKSKKALGICALWHEYFRPKSPIADDYGRHQIQDLRELGYAGQGLAKLEALREGIAILRVAAATVEWPATGRRATSLRLPGNPNVSAFDLLVLEIIRLADRLDGDLTFAKTECAGSLIDFLNEIRDLLPKGLVPNAFVRNRLEYLRQAAKGNDRTLPKNRHWWDADSTG